MGGGRRNYGINVVTANFWLSNVNKSTTAHQMLQGSPGSPRLYAARDSQVK